MSEARRLIKNTGIIAIGGMATKAVQFLLLPLYTAALSPSEYGVIDYLNTIALFCVPVVTLLMDEALFRFLIDCQSDRDRARAVTASTLVLGAGSLAFLVVLGVLGFAVRLENVGWIAALVLSGTFLTMVSALLRGTGDTTAYTIMNFIASVAMIVMNIVFIVVFHWGVDGMLAATVISQAAVSLLYCVLKRVWTLLDFSTLDVAYVRDLVRYSIPLIPNKVSWTIMNMFSRLAIMNMMGSVAAGLFAVSYKFPTAMDTVYGFFYMSWKESSARALKEGDATRFYNDVYRAVRRLMMGIVVAMTAFMPLAYMLLIDSAYAEGLLYVPILLLATYYQNISGFYGGIFTAHKDTNIMGTTTMVSAVLCLVLTLVLIPLCGLYGAAVATLASTFCVNEYRRRKVSRHAVLYEDLREKAITVLCLGIVLACFYLYAYHGHILPLALGIVVACVYAVASNWNLIRAAFGMMRAR